MNTIGTLAFSLAATLACLGQSQSADISRDHVSQSEGQYQIVERGPDHRVWSRVETAKDPSGKEIKRTRSYTELATGLHYWDGKDWKDASAEFEVTAQGHAVAGKGRHKVTISPILNDENGTVTVDCDGRRLRSTIVGLAVRDRVSGNSVFIAGIKPDVVGNQVSANEIVFEDCSDGIPFDVRYVYERGGFHQDVILKGSPDPEWLAEQGFNPETSALEIWTEFFEAPSPHSDARVISSVNYPLRSAMSVPDIVEEHLDFGPVSIPLGKAYSRKSGTSEERSTPVSKRWFKAEGRSFLVEQMEITEINPLISYLPKWFQAPGKPVTRYAANKAPASKLSRPQGKSMLLASAKTVSPNPGVVLDYTLTINGNLTNYTFAADTTYYVSAPVYLYGSTVMESAVIKYASGVNARLHFSGPLECRTSMYRPALLTAKDDDTVGETISGSSGIPSGTYAYVALDWSSPSSALDLHDLRISYANYGVLIIPGGSPTHVIRDSQFLNNGTGVGVLSGGSAWLRNLLLYQSRIRAVYGLNSTVRCENLTIDEAAVPFSGGTVTATNSLFVSVTNWTTAFTSVNNATNASSTGVFETVGAGAHYLPESSSYRGAGTTNVSQGVLTSLKQRTTSAPLIITNTVSGGEVELYPQVQRDTDLPDLGYHYAPIDYLTEGFRVRNAALSIRPGTVIAREHTFSSLWLDDGASIVCKGTPTRRVTFLSYVAAQEQPWVLGNANRGSGVHINFYRTGGLSASADFRLADFIGLPGDQYNFYVGYQWKATPLKISDCAFYGSIVNIAGDASCVATLHNNLFESAYFLIAEEMDMYLSNNLFRDDYANIDWWGTGNCIVRDNAFQNCTAYIEGLVIPLVRSNNAYIASSITPTNNTTELALPSFTFATGPLGDYYQVSTNLLNEGSRPANAAGLYHYTTTTNQVKEANTTVDIGLHYVATDSNGVPLDFDGDGMPDWQEDVDGDGDADGDPTSWQTYNSPTGLTTGNRLQVFTPLKQ